MTILSRKHLGDRARKYLTGQLHTFITWREMPALQELLKDYHKLVVKREEEIRALISDNEDMSSWDSYKRCPKCHHIVKDGWCCRECNWDFRKEED